MSLSCDCDFGDGDLAWYYAGVPANVKPLTTKRWRKCCSCGVKLNPGDDAAEFDRWRDPQNDIEERIYRDEVPLASWWACEICWGLMHAVADIGMCFTLGEDIRQQIKDYRRENP